MAPPIESALLKWAFEHSSDGIILTDTKGVIVMANDAFITMFGFSREEVIGRRTGFLSSGFSTPEFYETMWRSIEERGEWKGEIVNRTKPGLEKTCLLTISSVISEDGERIGYLGIEIDLTERKKLEAQIIQTEKLAAIGESMATLVHEIRNPLQGIAMNIYMLDNTSGQEHWTAQEHESIRVIDREEKRLEALVNDVLTFSRTAEPKYERVKLVEFMKELTDLLVFQARQREVELQMHVDDDTLTGRFDPNQIKQVLLNLAQNGIEASRETDVRKVRVVSSLKENASWNSISSSGKVLLFEIENSGVTIPEETRVKLFQPFFTTKAEGLGLGLATCAKIIRQHHGIVDVQPSDNPPYATIFTVALPA